MKANILFVDDEQNLLNSLQRRLRKHFNITTAQGPESGLACLAEKDPFAVIVSDLRMPVMDGIQFLSHARKLAPESVRIMLTGNADLQNAIQSVNEGNIYRFLTKPCDTETLTRVLIQGVEQYRLVTAEKELLEKTLRGSIKMLTEMLSLLNPEAFGRSARIKRYVHDITTRLGVPDSWKIETAAMLSQIGCVTVPEPVLSKYYRGEKLTDEENQHFLSHPGIAADLISHIPRMREIAACIAFQFKHFDGSGHPPNSLRAEQIPLGARILKVVCDFDLLESRGFLKGQALCKLKQRPGCYDPQVVRTLERVLGVEAKYAVREVRVNELKLRMILSEDVRTPKGQLLISRGQEVSPMLVKRLRNFAASAGVVEPIRVFVPLQEAIT